MVLGFLNNTAYGIMHSQQLYAESKIDDDHINVLDEKYREAKMKVYKMWETKFGSHGPKTPSFWVENKYCGPHYIVFGSEPNGKCTELYSSFTESHIKSIDEKLRRLFKIRTYKGKASILEPIPILDIMKKITNPTKEIFIDDGEGFPMKVTLGMWRNKEGSPFPLNLGRDGFRG